MAPVLMTASFLSCLLWTAVLCQDNICYEKADILFVMDSSGSVGPTDFQKQLQFAATLINNFQVGITQFSVLRFDSNPSIVIDFDDYTDNNALKNAILRISYPGGGTDTAAALKLAREDAFLSIRGARHKVPRIVIVSTDGQSNSPNATATEAARLKASNVLVLSIGVGLSYYKPELDAIATHPIDVFEVVDYNQLVSIVYDYSELLCQEVKLFKCTDEADVFFLLDSSRNVEQNLYRNEIGFLLNFTSKFDLIDKKIGVATFGGTTVQRLVDLGHLSTHTELSQKLAAAVYLGGATDTDTALKSIITQNVFDPASGGRADAAKILVILTDGNSQTANQARMTAAQLRATGVSIIAVGVSRPNLSELKELVNHTVFDVVTNLAYPQVLIDRVETLTAAQECKLPQNGARDVSDYCRQNLLENGQHPHPYDCTKFIDCSFLKTDIMPCPPDLVYEPNIQVCVLPGIDTPCGIINTPNATRPPFVVTHPPSTPKPCINGELDILFILDSSDTVANLGFSYEQRTAVNVAEYFNLSSNAIQFSATTFGENSHNLFNFNTFDEYKPLQVAILNSTFQGGQTNTYLALENALTLFNPAHGSRDAAPKVVVLFSNGRSSDNQRTLQAASALKSAGIHIITVGALNPNLLELQAIASSPNEVFINNFNGIINSLRSYSNSTCDRGDCPIIQLADVIFVLDSSASITDADYRRQLTFVVDVTNNFQLGPDNVQFGAVVFSQDTSKLFDLKDFNNPSALQSAIMSSAHLKSGTDTAKALNFVREQQMFSLSAGGRNNATKILVILTDGRSNSVPDTVYAALRLKSSGVKIIAVGVGTEVYEDELKQLASDAQSLFLVTGYDALNQIKASVTQRVCNYPNGDDTYSDLCARYSWVNGKHPNPFDCSTYVECLSFSTTLRTCNTGELYDPVEQLCKDRSLVTHSCSDPNYFGESVTAPPTVIAVTTRGPPNIDTSNLCRDYQLVDGEWPDPSLCTGFIECTAQTTQHLDCPSGLYFNILNSVCDDVHVVDCQANYNYYNNM